MVEINSSISIKSIELEDARYLVELLNKDEALIKALGSEKREISIEEFIKHNHEWCKSRNADMFAIMAHNIAIGTISLSHQNIKEKSAQIGYWIGSKYWGKGYTSKAFSKVIEFAVSKGFTCVGTTIEIHNIASIKIWEKHGAKIEINGNSYESKVKL